MFSLVQLALLSLVACSSAKNIGIVGGEEIDIREAPYQVSTLHEGRHLCGGTVVSPNVIITAAHCLKWSPDPAKFQIRAGSTFHDKGGVLHQVSDLALHDSYKCPCKGFDLGIMWLSEPLVFSDVIKEIGMAGVDEEIPDGAECIVTGWGLTQEGADSLSPNLRRVAVPKVSQANCQNAYNRSSSRSRAVISPSMICAGYIEGGKDSCQGDSGSPLVYNNKFFGIVSWGYGCARPGFPGVYANVAHMRPWIDANIHKLKMKHEGMSA